MIKRIRHFAFALRRCFKHRPKPSPSGFVNLEQFSERIEEYRRRGAKIGKDVRLIGTIDGINPHLISVGDYSIIGLQSALLAHCPINGGQPCRIGRYVYIAFNVSVLPGVQIGDYCVIGAGSVVTRDIPAQSIAAGNPAKVLRELTQEEKARMTACMHEHRLIGFEDISRD